MKKIKFLIVTLVLSILMPSCENDGGESKIDITNGALPNIQKITNSDAFINLVDVESGTDINLGITVDKAIGDISSMDVVALYIKSDGTTIYKAKLASGITNFPITLNISQTELYNAFDNLNSSSDFQIGDKLIISAELTLKNGSIQKIINDDGTNNFSPNIATSNLYKVFQAYNVSCPSDLAGTYSYSTTNVGEPYGYFTDEIVTGTVTFEDLGGGTYDISDASFGGYTALYGETAVGVQLIDICNKIAFSGLDQYKDTYFFSNLIVNGNTISFHWENDYGEFGDTILTRTDNSNWPDLTL